MSLEQDIKDLTESIGKLISVMGQPLPTIEEPKKPAKKKAVKKEAPVVEAPVTPEVVIPVPAPVVASTAPFTDGQGLTAYVMKKYQELGPEKGATIQAVLNDMGYQNINEVKPEHYSALHAGIEAL